MSNVATLPARSWAYPLNDLALTGGMLGAAPIIGSIVLGRPHVATIAIGVLLLVSVSAGSSGSATASPLPVTSIAAGPDVRTFREKTLRRRLRA